MLLWDTFFDAGEAQLKNGNYSKAEQLLKSALGEANSFEPENPRLLKTLLALISVYQKSERFKEAKPHLKRARELTDPPTSLPPELRVEVVKRELVQLDGKSPDPQAETELRKELVTIWQSAGESHRTELIEALVELAEVARQSAGEKSARTHLHYALEESEKVAGPISAEVDRALGLLVESFVASQDYTHAEEFGRRQLKVQTELHGEDDPRLAPTLVTLSSVLEKQRRMPEALSLLEEASSIGGEDRTSYYLSYVEALLRFGTPAEALAKLITLEKVNVQGELAGRYELLLLRAYQMVEDQEALAEQAERISADPTSSDAARLEALVCLCELDENQDEERFASLVDEIVELDSPELDDNGPLLARMADLARLAGRRDLSEEYYDRAIGARTKNLDRQDPRSVKVLFELGTIQERRRLLPEAVTSWERSLEYLRRHHGEVDTPAEERRLRVELVERLADIYIRQRRWERAEQAWGSLVRSSRPTSKVHVKGQLGLVAAYTGQGDHQKAFDHLITLDRTMFEESRCGRTLSDTAFLLEIINLVELGRTDEAAKKRDFRFSRRGNTEVISVTELYASCLVAQRTGDEERLVDDGLPLLRHRVRSAAEQSLVSKFYILVAGNNERYIPPEPKPFDLTSLQAYKQAVHWAKEANGEVDITVAELYEASARTSVQESEWKEAEQCSSKSLELFEKLKGPRSKLLLAPLQRLGELHLGKGELDEALTSLERATTLAAAHLKPQDIQVRELLRALVETYRRLGEFEQARKHLNQLLGLYERYEEVGQEGKLDDLLRGIRLLLGDSGDHRKVLNRYLEEATELALSRGVVAELSLAFCLGQKARLAAPMSPDQAIALLYQQKNILDQRDEAPEFVKDQLFLVRLLLFRRQPRAARELIALLDKPGYQFRKEEWEAKAQLSESWTDIQLYEFDKVAERFPSLSELIEKKRDPGRLMRAGLLALKLSLHYHQPELVEDEEAAHAYNELGEILDDKDLVTPEAMHEVWERRVWELARFTFEIHRLSTEAGIERLQQHLEELQEEVVEHPTPLADALALMARLKIAAGEHHSAYKDFVEARALYEHAGEGDGLSQARLLAELGTLAERLGDRETAVEVLELAVKGMETHLGPDHEALVPLHLGLGRLSRKNDDLDEADSSLQQALKLVDELKDSLSLELRSEVLRESAALHGAREETEEARRTWLRLQTMWEESGDLLPIDWIEEYELALVADGHIHDALDSFIDTLPLRINKGDDETLSTLYVGWLERIATTESGDTAERAAEQLEEVREVFRAFLDEEPTTSQELLWARCAVGFVRLHLAGLGKEDSVQEDIDEALEIRERLLGSEATEVGEVLTLSAELAFLNDDLESAEKSLTRALNIVESNLGPDTWEVAEILLQLATIYFRKHRFSPTEAVLQRTLELCRSLLDNRDKRWIEVSHLRGKLSLELGRAAEAFGSLDRALALSELHDLEPDRSLLVAAGRASLLTKRTERALELLTQAEAHFSTDPEEWDEDTEEVKLSLGELLVDEERYQEAKVRLDKVHLIQERRYGFGDPRLGRIYTALGLVAMGTDELDEAEEKLEIALALQEEDLFGTIDLFGPFYRLAVLYREKSDEESACNILENLLDRIRPSGRHEKIAEAARLLAESHERRGESEKAERAWRETIESLESAIDVANKEMRADLYRLLLEPLEELADLLSSHRRYTGAEELTKRRLKLVELLNEESIVVSAIHFDLAELYRIQELYQKAEELHMKVLVARRRELGANHPDVAMSLRALGQIALGEKDIEAARDFLGDALRLQKEGLGEDHPELAETLFAVGDLSLLEEDFATAEEHFRRALEILEESYGPEDFRTAKAWTALANLYEKQQQWSLAQPLLGRAMESMEAVLGPSHLDVADLLEKSAQVYLASGALDLVTEPLERALKIRLDHLGEKHPVSARIFKLQGDYNWLTGDFDSALRSYAKADSVIADYHGADSSARFPYRVAYAIALRRVEEFEEVQPHLTELLAQSTGTDRESLLRRATVRVQLSYLHLAQGKVAEAESAIKEVLETRSKFLPPNSPEVSSAMEALARIHHADGRYVTASALAERALDALEEGGPALTVLAKARIRALLAQIELEQENPSAASTEAATSLNHLRDLFGDSHPEVAAVLHLQGEIALSERRLEKAESYFEDALSRWEEFYGPSHRRVFQAVASLAGLYQRQGRLTLAEQFYQRNLTALEERFGPSHPLLVDTLIGLGKLCRSQGNQIEAATYLKRAAEIQSTVPEASGLRMAEVLHTLALTYQDQRNHIAAEALLKKARDLRERFSEPDSTELTESNLALARLYRSSGKSAEAEPLLRQVLEWRSDRLGEEHPEVASLLREMAELYADQKQYVKAQSLVKRALGIYGQALGQRNLELVGPLRQLARLLDASGDSEEAERQRNLAKELMGMN